MSVKKKRTIGPCRGVTWLYYVVLLWSRDFFPPLYLDPRFRPLLLKYIQRIRLDRAFVLGCDLQLGASCQDDAQALEWTLRAAWNGLANAQFSAGTLCPHCKHDAHEKRKDSSNLRVLICAFKFGKGFAMK